MEKQILSLVVLFSAGFVSGQYDQGAGNYQQGGYQHTGYQHPNRPPSNILLHKQALGQDGSFNYAFAADNGLQQGEIINPDGSRKGSYSYVDPNGKTVTLSYTAGKDGFRILNGDHVPKAPEPQQQRANPQQYYQQQQQQQPQSQAYSRPQQQQQQQYFRPEPVPFSAYKSAPGSPVYRGNTGSYEEPYRQTHQAQYVPVSAVPRQQYNVQEGNKASYAPYVAQQYSGDYQQEDPRKPHSFGNGYSFEFAG